MSLSKTSVLGLLGVWALVASASQAPDLRVESGDLLLNWTIEGLAVEPVSLQGEQWLQVSGRPDLLPVSVTGAPAVPALHEWIRLSDLGGFEATVEHESWSTVEGTVMPEQEREFGPSGMPFEWALDASVYNTAGWYPAAVIETGSPVLLRNNRLARLTLHPVQTDPRANRTRILQELTVRITFTDLDGRNQRLHHPDLSHSPLSRALASGVQAIGHPDHSPLNDLDDIRTLPGTYRVYARTTAVSTNAMLTNLLNWKREKGHVVDVITSTTLGGWSASLIKADITNAYLNGANPPDYVLLVGDPTATTSSDYWLPCGDTGSDGTQDHYYAMIEGGDNLGDVAVGRFSVNNSTQLQTVANKVLVYETAPQTSDATMAWLDRAALAVGYDALSMRQLSAAIIDDMVENGLNPAGIATRYGGTSDSQGSWVSGQFGSGIGLYNYRGWIGMNGVDASFVSNAANFTNTNRTPVAAVFTCSTGDFNNGTSTTEAFLVKGTVAAPQGAVCAMGLATSLTHTAYNNVLVGGFWSAVLDHKLDQVGPAMFYGKAQLVMNMPENDASADAFSRRSNLMGDPGMDIWVGTPDLLGVALAAGGTTVQTGSGVLDIVATRNGNPAEGIAVCLYQAGTVFSRGVTDATGHVLLDASGATAGTLKLTASRSRNLPARVNLTVATTNGLAGVTSLGVGGDGLAAPGEAITLLPVAQNPGATSIAGLTATLAVDPVYGTVGDANGTWPTLSAGGSAAANNGFGLTLAAGLANGTQVPLVFTFNTPLATSWTRTEFLTVSAPYLQPTATAFAPGGSQLSPGTSATLSLTLGNLGTLAASNLGLTLGDGGDDFVSVTGGTFNNFNAAAGGSAVASFTLSAAANSLRGHVAHLPLTWSAGPISGSTTVSITVGVPGTASPTGPDAYGYYAIEDTDFHSLAPQYQWIEIATPAGGIGTFLDLGDNGNEEDNAAVVALPFPFTYYGVSYTEMVVCSNGFVSFDEGAEVLHDFRNHYFPSGMGPDAMIGVNWDDHKSTGSNGVYLKSLPADHAYVVEWYNMSHNPTGGSNTFQLVLYDPAFHTTPTGDGPFKMQYALWNNIQSGSSDFDYCSVGIKDHTSTIGLTLSNFNLEPETVEGFEAGRAVYFTTDPGWFDDSDTQAPVILVSTPVLVEPTDSPVISATITDQSGVLSATLYYSTNGSTFLPVVMNYGGSHWSGAIPAFPLGTTVWYYVYAIDSSDNGNSTTSSTYSYTVADGNPPTGPDSHGYRIYDRNDAGEAHDFSWIDISGSGTQLSLGDDAASVVSLPFPVVFFGTTFTQLSVCSNGFVNLGNTNYTSYSNTTLAAGNGTPNMICAFWDDLNPNNGGNIRVYDDAANDRFVVSWIGVPHFSGGGPESFQIVFYNQESYPTITGDTPIHFQYQVVDSPGGCTVGHQNGTRSAGIQYLNDGSYAANAEALSNGQSLWLTTGAVVTPPPVAVTDLQIGYGILQATLFWTGTGAAQYHVYQGSDVWGPFTTLAGSTTDTFLQVPVPSGRTFFQVRADNQPPASRAAGTERQPVRVLHTVETQKQ